MKTKFCLVLIGFSIVLISCAPQSTQLSTPENKPSSTIEATTSELVSSITTGNAVIEATTAAATSSPTEPQIKPSSAKQVDANVASKPLPKNSLLEKLDFDPVSAMQNWGYATTDGEFDYISNAYGLIGEIIKINRKTGKREVLLKTAASCISYYDGWLYFIDNIDNNSIYKMRSDGKKLKRLLKGWVDELYCLNGSLYFTHVDRGHVTEILSLEGKESGTLIDTDSGSIRFTKDKILYEDSSYALCAYNPNGSSTVITPGKVVMSYITYDDSLYYHNVTDDCIVKMSKDLKTSSDFFKLDTKDVYFSKSGIYAIEQNYDGVHPLSIIKIPYDGGEAEILYSDERLCVEKGLINIGDTLYFFFDDPEYVRAELLYSLKEGVLSGPLNEESIKPPDTMKKTQ